MTPLHTGGALAGVATSSGVAPIWSGVAPSWSGVAPSWSGVAPSWSGIAPSWSGVAPSAAVAPVTTIVPGTPVVVLLVVAVLLLVVAALFSAAESALARISRSSVTELEHADHPAATRVARLVEHRETGLAGLMFVRVLVEMTTAVLLTVAAAALLEPWWLVALGAVGACLVLVVVVAGIGPRRLGQRQPGNVLARLSLLAAGVTAVAGAFGRLGRAVAPARQRSEEDIAQESADELQQLVDRMSESERLEDRDRELLESVFQLGRTYVREVMVPRTDMVSIEAEQPLSKALNLFTRSGFSRVPVHGESLDDLRGVLYLKDVMRRVHRRMDTEHVVCADVMREPFFVPETKLVDDMLREMQLQSVHIAVAVDEYGGVAGLVTIEDLLEELVGEMVDEHDRAETVVEDLGDGRWRVPARTPVSDLGELFDLELDDDDVDTAGGLLAKALGKVPLAGAAVDVDGVHLEAERVEGRRRRVSTILARRSEPDVEEER
ncbi:hemolysin family protein [Georgenia sp. Z1344]|uniref:hemolysin family protein n=1 Tax=Georgenia sp. Z1344 TaxID=3416706 RepID=UPI003CF3D550